MGAISFVHEIEATSAKKAFEMLCAEAEYEHGNHPYNGTINTCYLGNCIMRFDKPTEKRIKDAYKHADEYLSSGKAGKCNAHYIDLGAVEYRVSTFKKKNLPDQAPKYKLGFTVETQSGRDKLKTIFATKTEAMGKALEQSVKTGATWVVKKEYVLVEGDPEVGVIEKEVKSYKSMPKLKPMPNRTVETVHKYIFLGWASY